jgi:hypothetical protein
MPVSELLFAAGIALLSWSARESGILHMQVAKLGVVAGAMLALGALNHFLPLRLLNPAPSLGQILAYLWLFIVGRQMIRAAKR